MATRKKDNSKVILLLLGAGAALYFLTRKANAETATKEIILPVGDPNATELKQENIPPVPAAILPDTGPVYSSPPLPTAIKPTLTKPDIVAIETMPIHGGFTPGGSYDYSGGKHLPTQQEYNANDHLQ